MSGIKEMNSPILNRGNLLLFFLFVFFLPDVSAQRIRSFFDNSSFSAQIQSEIQYCFKDSLSGKGGYANKFLNHTFLDGTYSNDYLHAGLRFEMYENPLPGFEADYKGVGVPYYYLTLQLKKLVITGGDFYEQFGSGIVLRAYQERALGIDNALRGGRILYTPFDWMRIKALAGVQRNRWNWNRNWVKGIDFEIELGEQISFLKEKEHHLLLGGNFVSKSEQDELILIAPDKRLNLPHNVGVFSTRFEYQIPNLTFRGEYAWKANDPSADNFFIYRPGQALLFTASWFKKGLGVTLSAKHCDNMSFRSSRLNTGIENQLNYLPAFTRQHTYMLASLYPYATQINGEVAFQADFLYRFAKGTFFGGKYGTDIRFNYSQVFAPDRKYDNETLSPQEGTYGYTTRFFAIGKDTYYRDINVELSRKVSTDLKLTFMYMNQHYNFLVQGKNGLLKANIGVVEMLYKISPSVSLRSELQYLSTRQDQKDWMGALIELSLSPHWMFTLSELYNPNGDAYKHYPVGTVAYSLNSQRIQLTCGQQRAGYSCAGGICRYVPASKGFSLSYTATF